jgi:Protein of unknown function DUF72
MEELLHEWTAHQVRAWGRHGIRFGYAGAGAWNGDDLASVLQRSAAYCTTTLIDPCDLNCHPAVLTNVRETLPEDFRCVVAAESDVTTYRFPHRHPDREKRGQVNARFLDPEAFREETLPRFRAFLRSGDIVLLRFAPIFPGEGLALSSLLSMLRKFCGALSDGYHYAFEFTTQRYLLPDYFACLAEYRVAHVLRDLGPGWSILDQALLPGAFPAGYAVLRCGPDIRALSNGLGLGVIEAVRRSIDTGISLYAHVEVPPAGESAAELFFSDLLDMMNPDLAKLSPIRRKAA